MKILLLIVFALNLASNAFADVPAECKVIFDTEEPLRSEIILETKKVLESKGYEILAPGETSIAHPLRFFMSVSSGVTGWSRGGTVSASAFVHQASCYIADDLPRFFSCEYLWKDERSPGWFSDDVSTAEKLLNKSDIPTCAQAIEYRKNCLEAFAQVNCVKH
jgi:hypothetical protein